MSLKDDAFEIGATIVVVGLALWWAERKIIRGLSSAGATLSSWASDAGAAIVDTTSAGWTTATNPVIDPNPAGPANAGTPLGTVTSGAASVGNGIVAAPSNALDSLSLGLIGGSGGTGGSGGLWGWLSGIVDGSAFAPKAATQPDPTFDLGNSNAGW